MSYLLKALEKAEQERERQSPNEVLPFTHAQEPSRLPMGLMIFIVLALGATLLKVIMPVSQEPVKENVIDEKEAMTAVLQPEKLNVADAPSQNEPLLEPILITPDTISGKNFSENTTPVKESSSKEEIAPEEKVLELYELPKNILAKIPTLTLESHIYSSAAEYRSVVINGRTFKEGMMINAQVVLNSITNKGVVLDVSGQKVSLDKGITWVASSNAK